MNGTRCVFFFSLFIPTAPSPDTGENKLHHYIAAIFYTHLRHINKYSHENEKSKKKRRLLRRWNCAMCVWF